MASNSSAALRDLALQIKQLDRRIRASSSTGQLGNSSFEDGAIQGFSGDQQVMVIGRQWDGTYTTAVTNGPTPPTPSAPVGTDGSESVTIAWDGTFLDGAILPMDFLRVDIHVGDSGDFVPSHSNRFGSISAPTGGSITLGLPAGTYFVKLVCWSQAGVVSAASPVVEVDSWPIESSTDGFPPEMSPEVDELWGGIDALYVRWTAISNPDPVEYEVHIGLSPSFIPDTDPTWNEALMPRTLVGITSATAFTIKALPGDAPENPDDEDPRKLQYDTLYRVKIVARDADGRAEYAGTLDSAYLTRVTNDNLAANSVTAINVVAGSFTGEEFSGDVAVFSQFRTADTGQRLEWGVNGIQQFRSDESRRFYVPPTDDEDIYIDAQIKARGLQVVGGASFEGTQNTIEKEGALRLANGVSSSSIGAPQVSVFYETVKLDSGGTRTGELGTFAFNPTEVNFIAWNPANKFNAYQYRPNLGTRVWRFNLDGTYYSHSDYTAWEFTGETWLPGESAGYIMFRHISGEGTQYYVTHDGLFNKYSRQDGTRIPSIGNNGVNIYSVETMAATGQIRINIRTAMNPTNHGNFPAPSSTINSATSRFYNAVRPTALFGNFAGGVGGNRFAVSETGGAANIQMFNAAGTWLDDDFEAPLTKRGILYDGSNFWTLGNDGYLYKHTNFTWGASASNRLWSQLTLRRASLNYETTPGPTNSLTMKRRANVKITYPDLPFAGEGNPEDPDRWVLYAATGASKPANSGMWKQGEAVDGVTSQVYTSLSTTSSNPPTSNSFPGATPAEIRNDDLGLRIKGDGIGRFTGLSVGPAGGTAVPVSVNPPLIQYMTSSGNWNKPAGLKMAFVECVGGSGGSGGIAAITGSPGQAESGAGGGGSWSGKRYLAADLPDTVSVTVGAGGNGGNTSGSSGTAGGSTIFLGQTAGPGQGGTGITAATSGRTATGTGAGAGGDGGVASGGDMNLPGEDGGHGRWMNGLALLAARGGAPPMGFGVGGNSRTGAGASSGKGYGAGAGPAFAGNAAVSGASGQQGIVRITCYF
jgi:hypothetical protein